MKLATLILFFQLAFLTIAAQPDNKPFGVIAEGPANGYQTVTDKEIGRAHV